MEMEWNKKERKGKEKAVKRAFNIKQIKLSILTVKTTHLSLFAFALRSGKLSCR